MMTKEEIEKLLSEGRFPERSDQKKLVETHISWVILCDEFVYKIKKPILYPFLNFSTLSLRKLYCEREIELNRRMSKNVYLEVLPVIFLNGKYSIGRDEGEVIDYAVKMRKLDPDKQMDVLLSKNQVGTADIKKLARCIAVFHKKTDVIYKKDVQDDRGKFNELNVEKGFLAENLGQDIGNLIDHAIERSNIFLDQNIHLLENRLSSGFFRDCHGDLHTRNIFLLPAPQPFDCIEFNDDYRQIDVLNEIAFLCMDLDALQREDLSRIFIEHYNLHFPAMRNKIEKQLFIYYKSYRANVRAKVNSLRASGSFDNSSKKNALQEAEKYLRLMDNYLDQLQKN